MKTRWVVITLLLSVSLVGFSSFIHANFGVDDFESTCCESRFNVGAEWLYMSVRQDNLRAGTFIDDFPDPVLKKAFPTGIQPGFEYTSGFRVNAGYQLPCECWELNALYTYLPIESKSDFAQVLIAPTSTHKQYIIPNTNSFPFFQAFGNSIGQVVFNSLSTKWYGNLSYVDIDLARTLTFGDCLSLRPHLGFRGAWVKQTLIMGGDLQMPSTNNSTFGRFTLTEKFTGYGAEGGIWTDWKLGCGFSVLGHFGGSILYSTFKLPEFSESSLGEGLPPVFVIEGTATEHTATPTVEYSVALQYAITLCDFQIKAHIGWEQRLFFYFNQFALGSGNFSMQGMTLGLEVGF